MARFSLRRLRLSLARGLVLGAALAAAGAAAPQGAWAQQRIAPIGLGGTLTGDFLAARQAHARNEMAAAAHYYRRALRRAPENGFIARQALLFAALSGDVAQASRLAGDVLASAPDHSAAAMTEVAALMKAGRFAEARAAALVEVDDELRFAPMMARLMAAWSAHGAGETETARAELEAMAREPEDAARARRERLDRIFARYHLGLMALIDAEPERAVAAFQSARDAAGRTTPRLALMMGAALERAGQTDAAAAFYDQAIAESGGDAALRAAKARLDAGGALAAPVADQAAAAAEALYGLAALLTPTGEERARTALLHAQIALYLAPDLHEARLVVGEAFSALERDDAALAAFEAVPEAAPEYVSAQSARASALARMEKSDAALEALAGIVDRAPSPARVQFTIADVYRRDQRFEECVSAFDAGFARLAEDETVTWPVHFYHGVCLERAADWEKAEAAFGTALDLSPDEPEVLNYLGYSLVEQRRRLDEALEMIERAVRGKPDAGHIVDSLGWALYRLGDYERAVVQLEKAVELEPVEPVINDHLGDALWKVGRRLEAEFQWRRALSFEPEDADRARILRKLDAGLDAVLEEEARASSGAEDAAEGVDEGALRDQLAPDGADADAPQGG